MQLYIRGVAAELSRYGAGWLIPLLPGKSTQAQQPAQHQRQAGRLRYFADQLLRAGGVLRRPASRHWGKDLKAAEIEVAQIRRIRLRQPVRRRGIRGRIA